MDDFDMKFDISYITLFTNRTGMSDILMKVKNVSRNVSSFPEDLITWNTFVPPLFMAF